MTVHWRQACVIWGCLTSVFMTGILQAEDWPQWLGPRRDSVVRDDGLLTSIPETGLKTLWSTPIHGGYSGPAVSQGYVYVMDYVREAGDAVNAPNDRAKLRGRERVLCLSEKDGSIQWRHEYDCPYEISYPAGPRCTPTIDGEDVYTLGAEGTLLRLHAHSGEVLWRKDLKQDYNVPAPHWGFSAHPLVAGDLLYCLVGGAGSAVIAFDKITGVERWRALSAEQIGYCPPTIIHAGGVDQLLIWDSEKLNSLNPETGAVYWSLPLKPDYGMSITVPRVEGDLLFVGGIGNQSLVAELDEQSPGAKVLWEGEPSTSVYCSNSTPFLESGMIYGVDCRTGFLRGVDLKTGERLWETLKPTTNFRPANSGTAFLVKHQDRFFLFSETGDLIVAKLSRSGYEELGRSHLLQPTGEAFGRKVVWSHPAFANGCCFVRNDEEIRCVSLRPAD